MILRRHALLARRRRPWPSPPPCSPGRRRPAPPRPPPHRATAKQPTAVGRGGAVSTVDPEATRAGLRVLRRGGNAVDAAVAAAATLGVTEPYSSGIGGGGFFVILRRDAGKVRTLDGRETAPKATRSDTYRGLTFDEAVTSGLSVGVPGTPAAWAQRAAPVGDAEPRRRRCGRPPASPAAASSSTRPSATRPRPTRPGSATSCRPASCSCPAASCPPSARCSATRTSPTPTTGSARKGVGWLYDGRLGRQIVQHRAGAAEGPGRRPATSGPA